MTTCSSGAGSDLSGSWSCRTAGRSSSTSGRGRSSDRSELADRPHAPRRRRVTRAFLVLTGERLAAARRRRSSARRRRRVGERIRLAAAAPAPPTVRGGRGTIAIVIVLATRAATRAQPERGARSARRRRADHHPRVRLCRHPPAHRGRRRPHQTGLIRRRSLRFRLAQVQPSHRPARPRQDLPCRGARLRMGGASGAIGARASPAAGGRPPRQPLLGRRWKGRRRGRSAARSPPRGSVHHRTDVRLIASILTSDVGLFAEPSPLG